MDSQLQMLGSKPVGECRYPPTLIESVHEAALACDMMPNTRIQILHRVQWESGFLKGQAYNYSEAVTQYLMGGRFCPRSNERVVSVMGECDGRLSMVPGRRTDG